MKVVISSAAIMAFLARFFGVFFILGMLMLVALSAPPQKPPPPPVALSLGGYNMALYWPPAFCYLLGDDCDEGVVFDDAFTAHGLWPLNTNFNSMKPKWGKKGWKSKFAAIPGNLAHDLAPYWKNYNKSDAGDNVKVWKHEWDKHGENGRLSQNDYFMTGLELTKKYGKWLVQILEKEDIKPHHKNTYRVEDIKAALLKGLEVMPEVVCKEGKVAGAYVLSEIRVILDTSTNNRLKAKLEKCTQKFIYFPSTVHFSRHIVSKNTEL